MTAKSLFLASIAALPTLLAAAYPVTLANGSRLPLMTDISTS